MAPTRATQSPPQPRDLGCPRSQPPAQIAATDRAAAGEGEVDSATPAAANEAVRPAEAVAPTLDRPMCGRFSGTWNLAPTTYATGTGRDSRLSRESGKWVLCNSLQHVAHRLGEAQGIDGNHSHARAGLSSALRLHGTRSPCWGGIQSRNPAPSSRLQ